MKLLHTLERVLNAIETSLLVVLLSTMVILAFTQVVLRNLFDTGFVWADTLVRHLVLWVGFLGAALATSDDRHISIDALTKFLSPRVKQTARILSEIFAAVVCFYLGDAAWTYLALERESGGELILSIPTWVAIVIIPAGYFILSFHFLVKVIESSVAVLAKFTEAR